MVFRWKCEWQSTSLLKYSQLAIEIAPESERKMRSTKLYQAPEGVL